MLFKEMGVILVVAIIVILSLLAKITNIAMTLYRLKLASWEFQERYIFILAICSSDQNQNILPHLL